MGSIQKVLQSVELSQAATRAGCTSTSEVHSTLNRLCDRNHPNLSIAVMVVTLNIAPSERLALVSATHATGRCEKLLVDHLYCFQ